MKEPSVAVVKEPSVAGVKEPSVAVVKEPSVAGVKEPSVAGVKEPSVAGVHALKAWKETCTDGVLQIGPSCGHPAKGPVPDAKRTYGEARVKPAMASGFLTPASMEVGSADGRTCQRICAEGGGGRSKRDPVGDEVAQLADGFLSAVGLINHTPLNALHQEHAESAGSPRLRDRGENGGGEGVEPTEAEVALAWKDGPLSKIPMRETTRLVKASEGDAGVQAVKRMLASNGRVELYKQREGPTRKDEEKVRIHTEGPPIARAPTRESPANAKIVADNVRALLDNGQIRPSESPWASGVVLVSKKDGSVRFCCDFRGLNAVTKRDAYPLPRIDDTLAQMAGLKWISTVDFKAAYWQLPMHEDDREKTAFVTQDGLYEWNVMPFGLKNASGVFSRFIAKIVGQLRFSCLLVYIDDIIIFSKSFDDHLRDVGATLDRLNEWGVVLKPSKCKFFVKELDFLGHVVGEDGVRPSREKTAAIDKMEAPTSAAALRAFLGMTGYYRSYIKGYAKTTAPLMAALVATSKGLRLSEGLPPDALEAFNGLRQALVSSPILAHPRFDMEFEIHCDASEVGFGAVLVQKVPNADTGKVDEVVIQYASRATKEPERKYCQYLLECAALVWAVRVFRTYVAGGHFTVVTDNQAVQYLLKKEQLGTRRVAAWVLELQEYDFTIVHRSGTKHGDADGPSRNPVYDSHEGKGESGVREAAEGISIPLSLGTTRMLAPAAQAMSDEEAEEKDEKPAWVKSNFWERVQRFDQNVAAGLVDREREQMAKAGEFEPLPLDWDTFAAEQGKDKNLDAEIERWSYLHNMGEAKRRKVFEEDYEVWRRRETEIVEARKKLKAWKARNHRNKGDNDKTERELGVKPEIPPKSPRSDVFYNSRVVRIGGTQGTPVLFDADAKASGQQRRRRLIVPKTMVPSVLRHFHGNGMSGHMGRTRTEKIVLEYFYWKAAHKDIARWIKACVPCARRKPPRPLRVGLTKSMNAQRPGQIWCIDFVGPFPGEYPWILTMHDQFTRWPIAIPCKERNQGVVITHVMNEIVLKHGPPEMLWSDREPGFAGAAMKDICERFGIKKAETTGFQPQANSSLERFHSFMAAALTILVNRHKTDWERWLEPVLWMYRTSVNATTGFTPFFLMYGREPRVPVLAQLGLGDHDGFASERQYGLKLTEAIREAYRTVRERQRVAQMKDKARRDGDLNEKGVPSKRSEADTLNPPGSLAMFWEPERRVKSGKTPRKLEFRYTGPWRVHRACGCGLHRWIIHTGREKLVKVNVNRLREFTPWDTEHVFSNEAIADPDGAEGADEGGSGGSDDEEEWGDTREEGELVIVRFELGEFCNDPFLVGRVLQVRPKHENGYLVQWFGNIKGDPEGPQLPGWVQPDKSKGAKKGDTKHYFAERRTTSGHKAYTNDVGNTIVTDDVIVKVRAFELQEDSTLPEWTLDDLAARPEIEWERAPSRRRKRLKI